MNWKKFKEEKPSEGEEVLAYHPSWIDEDFNPRGIRIGFWNGGDDFKSAHWWDYQDCYITISHCDCDDNSLFSDRIKNSIEPELWISLDVITNYIVPNPSKEWTGGDENGKWRDGTSRLDALNTQPFGFSIYAKPFLKRVIKYGNGETKVEYGRLNTEKGTYAHWLNCVTSISYNRHKQVMEVECNECTSKLFVDMIKSICNISEQVKSFINPEQIKAIAESNEPILLLSNS